jgi:hypothetical protein
MGMITLRLTEVINDFTGWDIARQGSVYYLEADERIGIIGNLGWIWLHVQGGLGVILQNELLDRIKANKPINDLVIDYRVNPPSSALPIMQLQAVRSVHDLERKEVKVKIAREQYLKIPLFGEF